MAIEGRDDPVGRTLETVWRMESPRLIAALTRMTGDVALAEDAAQDAFEAALRQWPEAGVPQNPAAWLTAVAKRRAIDTLRRQATLQRKAADLGHDLLLREPDDDELAQAIDEATIDDDLLRLMFICCHPVLSVESRVALTLRLLGGLRTDEIARAFLTREATIGQRISRAKRSLSEARVPFEVPQGADFDARLGSVLQVIYLVYNEGYTATSGDGWVRPALCEDALRLGRVLAGLVPDGLEVHGLVALMEIQSSRLRARTDPDTGVPVPLLEQQRSRWDGLLISRGLAALERADASPGARGPYTLQAAIAACHARARAADETDWLQIVALYDALVELTPSPVVELNRAVAVAMADGPGAGLELIDELANEPSLQSYHLLPAVRGDLLRRLGRDDEAAIEFARAASLTRNTAERQLLLERAREAGRAAGDDRP
jgi:RNA polymerase sigma-70 factor (ECF subfamily)